MAMADAHLRTTSDPAVGAPGDTEGREPGSATPEAASAPAEPEPRVTLTWAEQEVVDALKRLARAQSDLADLEARAAESTGHTFESADIERLEQLQGLIDQARAKASGRFGKAAARERLDELEMSERLVLERMGVSSYAEYRRAIEAPPVETVDPQVLAFAQRELASAKAGWLEVQALEIPPDEPQPVEPAAPEIDLTTGHRTGDVA